jgi:hypothetical protein
MTMLDNFAINGTVPITHAQVVDMLNEMKMSLLGAITEQGSLNRQLLQASATVHSSSSDGSTAQFDTWTWLERIHPVPQDFQFPRSV